jgi:Holliday junction DNA helicase RuvA
MLIAKTPPEILIDVGGLGYEVQVPMTTLFQLPAPGETVTLLVHHAVREDAHTLYGFAAERDRELFRHLIRVTGIGPRLALTILSRPPGVGKKTAERLLVEMRDLCPAGYVGRPAVREQMEIFIGYKPAEAARPPPGIAARPSTMC